MSLIVIIATRGRPQEMLETVRLTLPKIERDDTRLMICADSDDVITLRRLCELPDDTHIHISVKEREDTRGEKYDRALTECPGSIYLPCHDCAPILTPGFDRIILDAAAVFPDGIGCVYSPMANASFPAFQAITAKLVEKIGYIYSHDYPFWFIDHELDDIARMIGRYIFVDIGVNTTTMRPAKSLRLRELDFWTKYFDYLTYERREVAHRIIDGEDFIAPAWLKTMLKTQHLAVEARSIHLNYEVRRAAHAIESTRGSDEPPDEGYIRAKQKAERKIIALQEKQKAA
jgi:hypothetical protein